MQKQESFYASVCNLDLKSLDLANIGNGNRLSTRYMLTTNQNMIKVVEMALSVSNTRHGKRR